MSRMSMTTLRAKIYDGNYYDEDDEEKDTDSTDSDNVNEPYDIVGNELGNKIKSPMARVYGLDEVPLVAYALTSYFTKNKDSVRTIEFADKDSESQVTIETGLGQETVVLLNFQASMKDGTVIRAQLDSRTQQYRLAVTSVTPQAAAKVYSELDRLLFTENFYRGQVLRFEENGLKFVKRPSTQFDTVIAPPVVTEDLRRNTTQFIQDTRFHSITNKRGVLLYGPPGTGKTSLVEAVFNELEGSGVTCVFLTSDALVNRSFSKLTQFIHTYLAPVVIAFEDVDLIAEQRGNRNISNLLGDMLNWLSGVEKISKPLVVMLTTNRANTLDEAIKRPCRVDRQYEIGFPSVELLQKIWESKGGQGKVPQFDGLNITGAHIEDLLSTTKMLMLETGKDWDYCSAKAQELVLPTYRLNGQSSQS